MFTKFTRIAMFALPALWAPWAMLATFATALPVVSADPTTNWMGFRNQTGMTLILQETYANGRQGAAQKVFANETFRDTPTANGARKFTIANDKAPDKPLYTGTFASPMRNENILYILKSDGKGGITVETLHIPLTTAPPVKKK